MKALILKTLKHQKTCKCNRIFSTLNTEEKLCQFCRIISKLKNSDGLIWLPPKLLTPNPNNFRTDLDINEIVESMKLRGFDRSKPIKINAHGIVIDGHRRREAGILLALKEIPCVIENISEEKITVEGFILNITSKTISDIEQAKFFFMLKDKRICKTNEEIAKLIHKSEQYVQRTLTLTKLDDSLQNKFAKSSEGLKHKLHYISAIEDKKLQKIVTHRLLKLKHDDLKKVVDSLVNAKSTKEQNKIIDEAEKELIPFKEKSGISPNSKKILKKVKSKLQKYGSELSSMNKTIEFLYFLFVTLKGKHISLLSDLIKEYENKEG